MDLDRGWARPGPTPVQVKRDLGLAVISATLSVASLELFRSGFGAELEGPDIVFYLLFAVTGMLLAGRRVYPLTVLLLESALFIGIGEAQTEVGGIISIQIVLFVSLYSAWAWSRRTTRLYWVTGLVIVAMFGWLVYHLVVAGAPRTEDVGLIPPYAAAVVYTLAINLIYFAGAPAWGYVAWRSARQRAEISEQAAAERLAQLRDRERAVRDERVRIARDLHDVVAHHVSGIGVQAAGAGRVMETRPEEARRALGVIESSSRQAVQQMHQLVGLLRADDETGDRGPQPGLRDVHTLAAPHDHPAVTVREVGDAFAVPPTVGLSLFRVAQEAVANLRRHAGAGNGEVVVRFVTGGQEAGSAVEVEVIDDGRADLGTGTAADSGGFGLTGIRERAAMHGGECEIGPRPGGGFRVRVRIPVAAP